jgi:hypothetical protein
MRGGQSLQRHNQALRVNLVTRVRAKQAFEAHLGAETATRLVSCGSGCSTQHADAQLLSAQATPEAPSSTSPLRFSSASMSRQLLLRVLSKRSRGGEQTDDTEIGPDHHALTVGQVVHVLRSGRSRRFRTGRAGAAKNHDDDMAMIAEVGANMIARPLRVKIVR